MLALVVSLVALVAVSYLVEALRPQPIAPTHPAWDSTIPVRYVSVDGFRLRYIVTGDGPPLVLLHTLRTQLDMFQRMIPALAQHYRVYALDHPGHGFSDIPDVAYTPEFFATTAAHALDQLDLTHATVVGESIGGTIALLLAARHHPRVDRVVAINPYDYGQGRGLRRSSRVANVLFGLNDVPILGATLSRLRLYPIVAHVLQGGLYRPAALPPALALEMYRVGNRRGHNRAFMSLVHEWAAWDAARAEYPTIDRPVSLIYGDHDWSRPDERTTTARAIPGVTMQTIPDGGHFLSLDQPDALVRAIQAFAVTKYSTPTATGKSNAAPNTGRL
jgi:pimeloyl-ACP methyl ester carboxylesterase